MGTAERKVFWLGALCAVLFFVAGCAPLLVAGGAAGGYAIAKDTQDGQLIDDQKKV